VLLDLKSKKIDTSKLRKGDIVLTEKNKGLAAWCIKISNILTNGFNLRHWTHAALHIGDGRLIEAQPHGIVYNSIENYVEKNYLLAVYRNKYIKDDDAALERIVNFCEEAKKENYAYGWVGLVFYVFSSFLPISFNFIFDNKYVDKWCNLDNAYFCSELIADAYKEAGYRISAYDGWRIKPSDFIKNPFFEPVKFS